MRSPLACKSHPDNLEIKGRFNPPVQFDSIGLFGFSDLMQVTNKAPDDYFLKRSLPSSMVASREAID
jgi:hypothetical protein